MSRGAPRPARIATARVRKAEDALLYLQGATIEAERGRWSDCKEMYEHSRRDIDAARPDLVALGMYEKVEHAVAQSLELNQAKRHDDAQTLLSDMGRELREASGSNDALRRRQGLKKR